MPRPTLSIVHRQQIANALEAEFLRSTDGSEQWRDVVGWESTYQVSSLGRIRSKNRLAARQAEHASYERPTD
ncbi:NUMOD4 domain-containing protein [Paraburkholderia phytofirmans]|uniref:NUMOD4 domain-containing protein n=1 Tax=Paraburkholderia phytofirmans TaxID=261302 RepID=UPI0038BDA21F